MPGLVGLVVLDSFAFGVPMITTDYPYHSPEIDYLVHNKNGVVVDAWQDCKTYAYQVARLLTDEHRRSLLAQEGQAALKLFSVEQMAKNFSKGVLCCLEVV
jgi:glycosyltransferase involved in cell wall biosynthesis